MTIHWPPGIAPFGTFRSMNLVSRTHCDLSWRAWRAVRWMCEVISLGCMGGCPIPPDNRHYEPDDHRCPRASNHKRANPEPFNFLGLFFWDCQPDWHAQDLFELNQHFL